MKAAFYDRDGIIINMVYDLEQGLIETAKKPSQITFIPGIVELLKHTASLGYKNIIISNQAGLGIKKISQKNFDSVRESMMERLNKHGAVIDAQYYCFHHPFASIAEYKKKCDCRKPQPGLLFQAAEDHNIDLAKSWMIGDSVYDVLAGKASGCRTILLGYIHETGYLRILEEKLNGKKPDYLIRELNEAISIIKS